MPQRRTFRMPSIRGGVLGLLLATALVIPALAQDAGPPVVVAVDTSRSLSTAALGEVVDRLRLALQDLPADTPTGLLAFDDEPRWVRAVGAGPGEVAEALRELRLQGNFTLLNDALFVATRDLEAGGVILLATDGRDENSATTVDDIARRCEQQGVRILSVGTGTSVEEKALRRLALLSNGAYLGDVRTIDASAVAAGVAAARDQVVAQRQTSGGGSAAGRSPGDTVQPNAADQVPPPTRPAARPAGDGESAAASVGGLSSRNLGIALWTMSAVLLILTVVILLRTRRPARAAAGDPGDYEVADDSDDERRGDEAEAEVIRLELEQVAAAKPREAPEVTVDTAVFQQMTLDERLERTRVMSNHAVLIMRRQGEPPRSYLLDGHKAFAVGRDQDKNTLAVPDPALSAQHFKIVPRDDVYFFVDLDSTNGSFVGGRRVNAKRLRTGDVIRAGQVEFEYQNYL